MSYRRLARMLRGAFWHCELHAVFSDELGREGRTRYFSERGWTAHVYPIETVHTCRGPQRLANSDNLILLTAAWLAGRADAVLIVLASGDGALVCDVARFLTLMLPGCLIASLSLVGSTSTRLDTMRNPDLAANLAVGMDVLRRSDSLDGPHGRSNHRRERLSERVQNRAPKRTT